jgi:predicted  nucleic acid-binding Zn-ribbon protein
MTPPPDPDTDPGPATDARPSDPLHRLLELQDLDVAAEQLRHRRETLPERARMATAQAAVTRHENDIVALKAERQATLVRQSRAEGEIDSLADKEAAEEAMLYGGGVTAVREVEAIRAQLDTLSRRKSDLEDQALADMESVDELAAAIAEEEREHGVREREVIELIGVLGSAEAVIDSELAATVSAREALADGLPPDMLATYERLRIRLGGVAVARLEGGHCLGCHLALPATEIDAVRRAPMGTVVMHEECGRILVR